MTAIEACLYSNEIRSEPAHDTGATLSVEAVDASDDVLDKLASAQDGCVDVEADVRARYAAWHTSGNGPDDFDAAVDDGTYLRRRALDDLDGDGVKEFAWEFITPPVDDVQHIYRGGSCSAHLGELSGGMLKLEKTKHEGFIDVFVEDWGSNCEGLPCGCTPIVSHYQMSRGVYKENKARHDPGHPGVCTD